MDEWSETELVVLVVRYGTAPVSEIAKALSRPYVEVVCKLAELGTNTENEPVWKIPRGKGYDKVSIKSAVRAIDTTGVTVRQYARMRGYRIELFCEVIRRQMPMWFDLYRSEHPEELADSVCAGCGLTFVAAKRGTQYHSAACGAKQRVNDSYFGGQRNQTVGLDDGVCMCCEREVKVGLSAHHMIGKENDPENKYLVAICRGCHQLITVMGQRPFLESSDGWERLMQFVLLRRAGTLDALSV
jgi:hypothetical protein